MLLKTGCKFLELGMGGFQGERALYKCSAWALRSSPWAANTQREVSHQFSLSARTLKAIASPSDLKCVGRRDERMGSRKERAGKGRE